MLGEIDTRLVSVDGLTGPSAVLIQNSDKGGSIFSGGSGEEYNVICVHDMCDGGASNASFDAADIFQP